MTKAGKTAKNLNSGISKTAKVAGVATVALTALAAAAATKLVLKALDNYRQFEKGLVGVGKTADLSGKALEDMGKQIADMSLRLPIATTELLSIGQMAGQLGVKGSENILNFTEVIAKMTRATDLTGEAASTMLARILNVTGEGIPQINKLASVIVALGNSSAATESEITQMTNEIVKVTALFKVSSGEAAAMAATMKSLGIQSELGRSAMSKTFQALNKLTKAGGKDLEKLAELTGMTGEQFKKTFKEDSTGAFQAFVEGLGKLDPTDVADKLKEFGLSGEGILNVLPVLAQKSALLGEKLNIVKKELADTTALNNEFARSLDTLDSRMILAENTWNNLLTTIGKEVEPQATIILEQFINLINDNKETIKSGAKLIAEGVSLVISSFDKILKFRKELEVAGKSFRAGLPVWMGGSKESVEDINRQIAAMKNLEFAQGKLAAKRKQIAADEKKIFDDREKRKKKAGSSESPNQRILASSGVDPLLGSQTARRKAAQETEDFLDDMLREEENGRKELEDQLHKDKLDNIAEINQSLKDGALTASGQFVADLISGSDRAVATLVSGLAQAGGQAIGAQVGGAAGGQIGGIVGGAIFGTFTAGIEQARLEAEKLAQGFKDLEQTQQDFNQEFKKATGKNEDLSEFTRIAATIRHFEALRAGTTGGSARQKAERQAFSKIILQLEQDLEKLRQSISQSIISNLGQIQALKDQKKAFVDSENETRTQARIIADSTAAIASLISEVSTLESQFVNLDTKSVGYDKILGDLADKSAELLEAEGERFNGLMTLINAEKSLKSEFVDYQKAFSESLNGKTIAELTQDFNMALSGIQGADGADGMQAAFDESNTILDQIAGLTQDSIGVQQNIIKTLEDSQKSIFDKIFELTSGGFSPDQTFAQKQSIFDTLVSKAQGGDPLDISRLLDFTDTFLQSAQDQFKSSQAFTDIFNNIVNDVLPSLLGTTEAGIQTAETEVATLEGSLLTLNTSLNDTLTPAITNLDSSIQALTAAVNAEFTTATTKGGVTAIAPDGSTFTRPVARTF
jgi:TP901 family phage tail tape measure protein